MADSSYLTTKVGNYVTDSRKVAFINEQPIAIYCTGMRPSTRVYVYFDKVNVSAYVRAASITSGVTNPTLSDFNARSDLNPPSGFYTDVNGVFCGIFYLPANTFFAGDREIVIADVSSYDSLSTATTSATIAFKAFNYDPDATDPSYVSTRPSDSTVNVLTNRGLGTPTDTRAGIFNPMAFTFYIGADDTAGADGMYVTAFDLYFKNKSDTKGIVFDIRTVENGIPTITVIPNSRIKLNPSDIVTSNTGAAATKITFPAPIMVRAGYEYAICIIPDAASPDYSIWTAAIGELDASTASVVARNWGEGTLYTSTNGTAWTPLQGEFPKFKIYRAQFSNTSSINLVNRDYEFLSITNNYLSFIQGEYVYQNTSNATGTITCNTASANVIGTGTSFFTNLAAGSKIVVSNGSITDIVTVDTIANATFMTLKEYPRVVANSTVTGTYKKAVIGQVYTYNPTMYELILDKSNAANSSFCFGVSNTITGVISGATATVSSINNKTVNRFKPILQSVIPHSTSANLQVGFLTSNYASYVAKPMNIQSTNVIQDAETIIASKTNEILYNSGNKSLNANIALSTSSSLLSPVFDLQGLSFLSMKNMINDSSYNENKTTGVAHSRYISKRVTLKEGLDSESIAVYLNAYRPPGTDVEVYAKILNAADPDPFDTKDWSILQIDQPTLYSDVKNRSDFKEYKYTFTKAPASYPKPGTLATSNSSTTVRGTGAQFVVNLVPGDVIKIFDSPTSNTFGIHKVTNNYITASGTISCNTANATVTGVGTNFDQSSNGFVQGTKLYVKTTGQVLGIVSSIANSTSLTLTANATANVSANSFYNDSFITLDSNPVTTSNVAVYERVTLTNSAFKNPQNSGVVRYYSPNGSAYDSYRSFAIKIVLKSSTSYITPEVDDMRVLALSV